MAKGLTVPIGEAIDQFGLRGKILDITEEKGGHINSTYLLSFRSPNDEISKIILQRVNTHAFKNPDQLMSNIALITEFLKKRIAEIGGDPIRETLSFFPAQDGKYYFFDGEGSCWRCYVYVDDAVSYQSVENPEVFYKTGRAFGNFQSMLHDFPAHKLYETIPFFHDTPRRIENLKEAMQRDAAGRKKRAEEEIAFILSLADEMGVVAGLLKSGEIPLRVTHNDTKLNNVLFDANTGEELCVIDLDTVMPGSALYDFGDAIRYGANTAAEDEPDLTKVSIDLSLYKQYTKGYLVAAGAILTKKEIELLPYAAKLITFECGTRFLTDYLDGDKYFRIAHPEHNLDRCRTQFALVRDMEKNYSQMMEITQKAQG